MESVIRKREIEDLIGCGIADSQFSEALERAVTKQQRIYRKKRDDAVLQDQYLVRLVGECARDLVISRSMLFIYGMVNMEKERWAGAAAQNE